MNFIDPAGMQVWADALQARRAGEGDLYFHRPRPPVLEMWQRAGFPGARLQRARPEAFALRAVQACT